MLGGVLIAIGIVLMLVGVVALRSWVGGKGNWSGSGFCDRTGSGRSDRMLLYVTFLAVVLAPLLVGGILIGHGLHLLR